ncbi:MAG: arginine--tRNA ligase [Candidatus Pacearchaeota archaeon]|nr:arginine--tRNA ligase [Candidatus Pacearchaeota archaeon]
MLEEKIKKIIAKVTGLKKEEIFLEKPKENYGDFAFPCFKFASSLGKKPEELAKELAKKIKPEKEIEKVEALNGYVNFFIKKDTFFKEIFKKKEKKIKKRKLILVESPGPNTNKPLHVGHLRNLFIGDSIARILEFVGYDVKRVDTINDRGIHICKSMLAYKKWGKNKKPDKKPDHFVGYFYVLFSKKAKENPKLEEEAQELLRRWENKDEEVIKLWKKMNSWAMKGIKQTYKVLGFKHDKQYFESETYEKGKEIVLEGLKRGIFKKEDKVVFVDLGELGKKILLRSDGTSLYITQDIYLAKKRYEDYKFDKLIYVVASEQEHHFKSLFKILELLGYKWVKRLVHLSYGMVHLPGGKMKSREGIVVDADDLIKEVFESAKEELRKRYTLKKKQLEKRALAIALAALRFFLLKTDIKKDILFDKKAALDFEGFSGPYLQYSYARACSILRKARKKGRLSFENIHETEIFLAKKIYEFNEIVKKAALQLKPDIIAIYCYELAQVFNNFYHSCPVLRAEKEKNRRIALVEAFKKTMKDCLHLLGIAALERM